MSHARELVASGNVGGKPAVRGHNLPSHSDRLDLTESISFFRRRMKLIALTDKGKTQVEKSRDTRHAWLSELSQVLSDAEKAQLLPAIRLLNQKTRNLPVDHHPPCQPDAKE